MSRIKDYLMDIEDGRIESCKHNDIDPGKYISYLLGKLKTVSKGQDLTSLLPCYCGV